MTLRTQIVFPQSVFFFTVDSEVICLSTVGKKCSIDSSIDSSTVATSPNIHALHI